MRRRRFSTHCRALSLVLGLGLLVGTANAAPAAGTISTAGASPASAVPAYPAVGAGTSFLDHRALLGETVEPEWYDANIPFVDLPDEEVEDTYYYRWRTYKEALKYTGPKDGWILSEFLGPVGYSAPFGGINAAAAHHIYEGRWLRDQRYVDDYLRYWLQGTGSQAKEANDGKGVTSVDWAHQYSFWAVDAAVERAKVTGDWEFVEDLLPELTTQYEQWKGNFDPALGLYWQTPVWDAMEFTASSYQSDDPYHGGEGFRPTINAYQYGDALALAEIYEKTGDRTTARKYRAEAAELRATQDKWLWDPEDQFYKHVMRDENPDRKQLDDREQIGFVPWYFHMPPAQNSVAWTQLTDPQGFAAPFGPTTTERRSPWFMHEALDGCCRWDGPSWPYATSQTLTAMANLLLDYPAQPYVDRGDYFDVLRGYALTQRKDGRPYVAEAHHPDEDRWIYDGRGHSEDYNHSTFNDLVINGLLGLRPQSEREVRIAPLVPRTWDSFALENVPYHGHNLSVVWDRDGTQYSAGAGLTVWVDGVRVAQQQGLDPVSVRVQFGDEQELPTLVDDFANVTETGYPTARASYTWRSDRASDAIDGQDFHLDTPSTRWTTYASPNREDWLEVDLGAPTRISDVRVSFYDDGGGVRTPDSFSLQRKAPDGSWADIPGQTRTPAVPVRGALNRVLVDPPVLAQQVRILPRRDDGGAVGITAFQSWRQHVPGVVATFEGLVDGAIALRAAPFTVTARVTTRDEKLRDPVAALRVPTGWQAEPISATQLRRLDPGQVFRPAWRVTPPADVDLSQDKPLRVSVTERDSAGSADSVAVARYNFDPADFSKVLWQDDFSHDRLADYRTDSPFGEVAPTLSMRDGALVVDAGSRAGALLAAPVQGSRDGTAVIAEPRSFAGTAPEDSLFLGLSAGDGDNVTLWYNNSFGSSGVDVRRDGRPYGDEASGGCCASVRWIPDDRFAAVFLGGRLTSWVEHDGTWRRLRSAPVSPAVDADTLASWSPAVGLRLEAGSMSLESLQVLGR